MAFIQIPDHLRSSLWGWSWNKQLWPAKSVPDKIIYKKKLDVLDFALMEDPNAENFYRRAVFYVEYGVYDLALNDFYQCVHEAPENHRYIAERADLFLLIKEDQQAKTDLLYLQNKIKEPKIYLKLCFLYLCEGNYFEAQFNFQQYFIKGKANTNSETLSKYIEHIKRQSALEMKRVNIDCEEDYTEENLYKRAQTKEKVFDLVGAAEDYMMLYLLFEKEEYQKAGYRVKMQVMEIRSRHKNN